MSFAFRMAWRETRPVFKRFLFLILAIAVGVGALTGLKGFSLTLNHSIFRSARDLVAGDIAVRFNSQPDPQEVKHLETLVQQGAELTRTTETMSMVSSTKAADPVLSNIRAVDPQRYPFSGTVELDPPASLRAKLSDSDAVVSRDLLVRTGVSLGDSIQIGSARFRISAILKSEPDRIAFGINLGPRILITRTGLERSGLIQFGSRASETFLFRLPEHGLSIDEARKRITAGIPRRVRITDYRDPNPSISRGLERTTSFLSLVGLLALLVGGLGVSTTIHTYLRQKLDSIAILKCIGGRSSQIVKIYLTQGIGLGILGSILGIALGYFVQLIFPRLLSGLIDLPVSITLAPKVALQGLFVGVLTTLLFLLPPLMAIRRIRPMRVFLREMPESRYSVFLRLRRDPAPLFASLVLLLGIGLLAGWLAESLRWGFIFLACLMACIIVLAVASWLMLLMLKRLPNMSSLALRHGIKNLYRPGNHASSVVVSLGLGVAFVLAIYFIQTSLLAQIVKSAPADFPNVFLLGITESDKPGVAQFFSAQKGIEATSLIPAISSHLLRIDGKTADQIELDPHERRHFQIEFSLTWSTSVPPDTKITEGQWWQPPYRDAMISVGEEAAQRLKIHIGSTLEFDIGGRVIRGRVVNLRDTEFARPGTSNQFIFSPGSLDGFPASYIGTAKMPPEHVAEFQNAFYRQFPNVISIDAGQVLGKIQDLLDGIAGIIRFIALFAILSGIIILASNVVSTRYQRIRETALLKTLGATQGQVAGIQATEFLILGASAGLIGGALAAVAAHYLLGNLLNTDFEFQWMPFLTGVGATAILAIATGWLASRGVLRQKPILLLREER
jgi:putative ABC transport system permease protein